MWVWVCGVRLEAGRVLPGSLECQAGFVWKGGKQDVLQGEFGRRRAEFGCFRYRETSFCACTLQNPFFLCC